MLKKVSLGLVTLGAAAVGVYLRFIRPWYRRWGATDEEVVRAMPGDDVIKRPSIVETYAVTIKARPAEIWPWLVQIGYKRGGFYSYDWLEKLMGLGISSTPRIIPEFQQLKVGDVIPFGPEGPNVPVKAIEPDRSLVLGDCDPVHGGATWSFGLYELDEKHTRLVSRGRMWWPNWTLQSILLCRPAKPGMPRPNLLRDLPMYLFFEPGSFLMFRKMLLGIKQRAERASLEIPEPIERAPGSTSRQNEAALRGTQ
jgi:hypothetical protein